MKLDGKSKLSAARATGGIVGATLAAVAIAGGVGIMAAAPFVGGIAVGMAVAGAVHGTIGVICGVVGGFAAASISGTIGAYAGLGVMALGVGVAAAVGAAVNGTLKFAGLGIKGAAHGVKKLLGFGRKKAGVVTASPVAPAQEAVSDFKAGSSKTSFEEAVKRAPQNDNQNDSAAPSVPSQKPNAPKL